MGRRERAQLCSSRSSGRNTQTDQSVGGRVPDQEIDGTPRLRVTDEQMELSKLRKKIQELNTERDIFKKAAASRGVSFGHTLREEQVALAQKFNK